MVNESDNSVSAPAQDPEGFIRKNRVALLVVAVVVILVAVIVLIVRHRSQATATGPGAGRGGQNGPVAVAVATVTPGDIQIRIPALGTVTTLANVTVRTQISGTLQKIDRKSVV